MKCIPSTAFAVLLSLAAGAVLAQPSDIQQNTPRPAPKPMTAQEKAKARDEVRTNATKALEQFYAVDPKIKDAVAKAAGYGVFTTYGVSFVLGGAGGTGLVHDAAAKKDWYMRVAQASAGAQIGAAQNETLLVFPTKKAVTDFVEKGWVAGASGGGTAGAAGKTGGSAGGTATGGITSYTMTKNGVQAGGAVEGAKYWKDKALN
ncbi:MAG: YSC84-related protein [Burkholderiales bacterium]